MHTNQALTFIKPHAVRSQATIVHIADTFKKHGIKILARRSVTAEEISAGGLVDRHYAANARRGTFDNALALQLKDSAKEIFQTAFDEDWDEAVRAGRIFSGEAMRLKLGNISGEELHARWARYRAHKLSGGCYVSYFEDDDCYVVNGFYPSIRELFTRPGAEVEVLIVGFDLPWVVFRRDIIGSTNPAAADENSIRGFAYDHASVLGIEVDSRNNVIHASASPFEGLCERFIWMSGQPVPQDPLWKLIHKKSGLSAAALEERLLFWHSTNPMVELPDHVGPLLDVLEDRDTPEVAQDLLALLGEK